MEKNKLAAIYNVWDGEELLRGSVQQIKDLVDVIIIIFQEVSNYGEVYVPEINTGAKTRLMYFTPLQGKTPTENETIKRNKGIELARKIGCTHYLLLDCDEYYDPEKFSAYKDRIYTENRDSSACRLYTFYKEPTIQIEPLENYYVPFIHKIYEDSKVGFYMKYPAWSDPTRRANRFENFLLIEEPIMYHYSWVRKDIGRKLRNSSARKNLGDIDKLIEGFNQFEQTGKMVFFTDKTWKRVENKFNIKL